MMAAWPRVPLDRWVLNGAADLAWHDIAGTSIAVTRSRTPRPADATYITALRTNWFDYAAQEVGVRSVLGLGISVAGLGALGLGLDRSTIVGNDPVSTNNRSAAQARLIPEVCRIEAATSASRHVAVRNLSPSLDRGLSESLAENGFALLPARVVYLFDGRSGVLPMTSHRKRDRALRRKSGLTCVVKDRLTGGEADAVHALYGRIYLERHSLLNAQYTADFFRDVVDAGVMRCLQLVDRDGILRAFALLQEVEGVLTSSAVGYDSSDPQAGYYRQLVAALLDHVEEERLLLNYSSGAGDFKRKRGGAPAMEYIALKAPAASRLRRRIYGSVARQARSLDTGALIARGA